MLHYGTINTKTLELLKEIQKRGFFKNLRLVRGTALALQIGHRMSDDLDLFGKLNADKQSITNEINKLGKITILNNSENINIFSVNGIKVDIVNYPYPWLSNKINEDNLYLADLKDIAAMKLAAITGRGTQKDFIDIYFLLKNFTLEEMVKYYELKYHDGSTFLVLKSLVYFDDADSDVQPKMLIKTDWEEIKKTISESVSNFVSK